MVVVQFLRDRIARQQVSGTAIGARATERIAAVSVLCSSALAGALIVRSYFFVALICVVGTAVAVPHILLFAVSAGVEQVLVAGGHASNHISPLVSAGNGIYQARAFGVNAVVLLAVTTGVAAYVRWRPALELPVVASFGILAFWCAILGLVQGQPIFASVVAATPWILLVFSMLVGYAVAGHIGLRRSLEYALTVVLVYKATISILVFMGGTAQPVGETDVAFYDSTTSYIAASAVVAVVLTWDRLKLIPTTILLAGLVVVCLSPRRNVILAAILVLLVLSLLRRKYMRRAASAMLIGTGILLVLAGMSSGATTAIGAAFTGAISTVTYGDGTDTSTVGHFNDLVIGYQVATEQPVFGLGVFPAPRLGLVVADSNNLYIHNEALQTWARFGLPGLLFLITGLVLAIYRALAVARQGLQDISGAYGAISVLSLPVPLLFFPQLSTTPRFALVVGLAIGLLGANQPNEAK